MRRDSLTTLLRGADLRVRTSWIAVFLGLMFGLSMLMVYLRFPGSSTAPWWPAVGVAVLAALIARKRLDVVVILVAVLTAIANMVTGTVWWVAIFYGIANAGEVWIITRIMRGKPGKVTLPFRAVDLLRFVIAILLGGLFAGLFVGLAVWLNGGDYLAVGGSVTASHASATLLIAGFGVIPLDSMRFHRPIEFVGQIALLVACVLAAFGPGQELPVTFLPFPALAWAAFRFGAGVALIEIAATSMLIVLLGINGGGPFAAAAAGETMMFSWLNQIFTLSIGIPLLLLAVLQDQRTALLKRLQLRQALLHKSLANANSGFIVLERESDGFYTLIEANPAATQLMPGWRGLKQDDGTITIAPALEALPGVAVVHDRLWHGTHKWGGKELDIRIAQVGADHSTVMIQAVDITQEQEKRRALKSALEQERAANLEMRALNEQKDDFVSSVSHELRTPVTSILSYSEELEDIVESDEKREIVEVISRNAKRLADLVNDILTLSRMGVDTNPRARTCQLASMLSDAQCDLDPQARARDIDLKVEMPDDTAVLADELWLQRILNNLLTNAIKFSPAGAKIRVSAEPADSTMILRIADEGPGLSERDLERVFEKFYRVHRAELGHVPGTGLGLPIVRELLTRMGGTITLESDGHSGTTAVVTLPRPDAASSPTSTL